MPNGCNTPLPNKHHQLGVPDWEFRVVLGVTKVEYAHEKERSNRLKHGYSLESAVGLLERMVFPFCGSIPFMTSDAFVEAGEVRHKHMTVDDDGKVVFVVTTMRPNETVRVISYRRASSKERKQFAVGTGFREA